MQKHKNSPAIVATIDLTDDKKRHMHDVIHRTHTGRWPTWEMLAMRQRGDVIYEAAREIRRRRTQRSSYVVLTWSLALCGVSITPVASRRAALALLKKAQ